MYSNKNKINVFFVLSVIILTNIQVIGINELIPNLSNLINALCIVSTFLIGTNLNNKYNKNLIYLGLVLTVIYIINFILTDYASFKWLINSFGFITIFTIFGNSVKRLKQKDLIYIDLILKRYFLGLSIILIIIFIISTVFISTFYILTLLQQREYNSITAQLNILYGVEKQGLGNFLSMILIWTFLQWKSFNYFEKNISICLLCSACIFFISIRTSILATILLALYLFRFSIINQFLAVLIFIGLIIYNWGNNLSVIMNLYDRIPSVVFSFEYLQENIFGIGNGGYHIYVIQHQQELFARYQEYMTRQNHFYVAPETDIAYFVGSFGLLSLAFFSIYLYILFKGKKIITKLNIANFEKYLILYMVYLIFAGIAQDNAVSLVWWIYLSASFGVIFKYQSIARLKAKSRHKSI